MELNDILKARKSKHGEYTENSRCTWEIMRAMMAERNWSTLDDKQKHSLYMVAHKMARIVTGDPDFDDHWDDIAGYAKLVADRIRYPVEPYDAEDIYAALALGWGCDRDTAMARVRDLQQANTATTIAASQGAAVGARLAAATPTPPTPPAPPTPLPKRPGGPVEDDGPSHAAFSDEELEKALKDVPF
jgi:hypothetical protein